MKEESGSRKLSELPKFKKTLTVLEDACQDRCCSVDVNIASSDQGQLNEATEVIGGGTRTYNIEGHGLQFLRCNHRASFEKCANCKKRQR